MARIDSAVIATDVTQSINVLAALRWVAIAWREVKATTIKKCFRQAGILNTDLSVQALCDSEDPFQDIDAEVELNSLISSTMGTLSHCSAEEYIEGDDSLPICVDIDGEDWDECWLNSLVDEPEHSNAALSQSDDEQDQDDDDM